MSILYTEQKDYSKFKNYIQYSYTYCNKDYQIQIQCTYILRLEFNLFKQITSYMHSIL